MWKIYSLLGKLCLVRLIVRGFLKIQKYAEVFIIEFTVAGQPINSIHIFQIINPYDIKTLQLYKHSSHLWCCC